MHRSDRDDREYMYISIFHIMGNEQPRRGFPKPGHELNSCNDETIDVFVDHMNDRTG
jgi:hypothetical protein